MLTDSVKEFPDEMVSTQVVHRNDVIKLFALQMHRTAQLESEKLNGDQAEPIRQRLIISCTIIKSFSFKLIPEYLIDDNHETLLKMS